LRKEGEKTGVAEEQYKEELSKQAEELILLQ